jgi:hypothetical protein
MHRRYQNLYALHTWRRYGNWLLVLALGILVVALVSELQKKNSGASTPWMLAAAVCLGLATSMWLRQRFSYVELQGDRLLFRVGLYVPRSGVALADIRRARVGRLLGAMDRPERRRYRPRGPVERWQDTEVLLLRLRQPDDGRLRRMLGRRCVFDDEVVLPLGDAAGLLKEIEAAMTPSRETPVGPYQAVSRRGRRRR